MYYSYNTQTWFYYNDSSYSSYMPTYEYTTMIFVQHNDYASMMITFESEYPFGDFLEDTKFDELSEYLKSHFRIIMKLIQSMRETSPCMLLFFVDSGIQRVFIQYSTIFPCLFQIICDVVRLIPIGF